MFSISGDFSNGVYSGNSVNGFKTMIMQSSENVDTVVNDFEKALAAGLDPNAALRKAMDDNHLTDDDFTNSDINRVNKKIEEIYRSNRWRH